MRVAWKEGETSYSGDLVCCVVKTTVMENLELPRTHAVIRTDASPGKLRRFIELPLSSIRPLGEDM